MRSKREDNIKNQMWALQVGHVFVLSSHGSRQSMWKLWPQGSLYPFLDSSVSSSWQTEHSFTLYTFYNLFFCYWLVGTKFPWPLKELRRLRSPFSPIKGLNISIGSTKCTILICLLTIGANPKGELSWLIVKKALKKWSSS